MIRIALSVLLALVCMDALAATSSRRVTVLRNGDQLQGPLSSLGISKAGAPASAAFCSANPEVAISFVETATVSPLASSYARGGSATISVQVVVDAVCEPGGAALSFRYGALPSSTAQSGSDYTGTAGVRVDVPLVPQFGSGTGSQSTSISFPDTTRVDSTRLDFGFIDGVIVFDPAGAPFIVRLFSDGSVLSSLVIDGIAPTGIVEDLVDSGGGIDPVAEAAIAPLADHCATTDDAEVIDQCNAILALAEEELTDDLIQVLRAISGEEVSAQTTTTIDTANQRMAQINGRIAALRGGATGISLEEVALNYRGWQLPVATFLQSAAGESGEDKSGIGGGLFDQRLGAFANVTVLGGERDNADFEVGFDFEGYSLLAGVDWRFSDRFIAGGALGWSDLSSDLNNDGGSLDSDGWSLTAYGTWLLSERTYLDFSLGSLRNDYVQRRVIDLEPLGIGFGRTTAIGRTEAQQTSLGLGGGADFAFGEWVYSPRGSVLATWSEIDGFEESGSGINDLIFDSQEIDSLVWTFSQSLSRSFSLRSGALQPYLTIDLSRETRNEAIALSPRLRIRPDQISTPIFIDEADRWYGRYDLGASFVGGRGLQWFLSYSQVFGYSKVNAWAVRGGLRFEF